MTANVSRAPTLFGRWQRRFAYAWRTLFAAGDVTALLIALALLLMPALALHQAGWPLELPVVLPVLVLSILFGFLLSRSHYNELFALIISSLYGISFVTLFAALNQPGGLWQGVYAIFTRSIQWFVDATTGGINQDDLIFTLLIATLFWFLGYNIAWHIFRLDRVWRVIVPPALILAINSIFYEGDQNFDLYLGIFLFLSLLLIVRSHLDSREWEWYVNGIRVPRSLRTQFLRVGAVLALLSLLVAWTLPVTDLQQRLNDFQNFLRSDPLNQMAEFWNRLFSPLDTQGPATSDYYGGDSLQLGGAIKLGDQIVFVVSAPPRPAGLRYYWRSRVFEAYERGHWTPAADTRLSDPDAPFNVNLDSATIGAARESVQQDFTIGLNASRIIYTAPQPVQVDLATRTDLRYIDPVAKTMNISVIRPYKVLYQGDHYTATSLVSDATGDQLRAAPAQYPQWVRDLYLQVSLSVTSRTVNLAKQIVEQYGATTPYDKAKAIETWLRVNIHYNESIPQPPPGQDPVDWVLFDLKQGYCTYYASAMIIMLRSLGIPARMAAGFAEGTWDADNQVYVVRERDAHIWVEAYFPGYGWIEFEPTAAQAPLNRDNDASNAQQPTPLPVSSPTPTPLPPIASFTPSTTSGNAPLPVSFTNTSTGQITSYSWDFGNGTSSTEVNPSTTYTAPGVYTVTLTVSGPGGSSSAQATITVTGAQTPPPPTATSQPPTPTITPSPTPTATPVIIPTSPPPITPPARNLLSDLLPALGIALLGLLLIIALAGLGVFIWWWWEWRGMKGLSPVVRAYARLERYLGLIGIVLPTQQTPEERRRRIVRDLPAAERPVTAITRLYVAERYGRTPKAPAEEAASIQATNQAWPDTRRAILRRYFRRLIPWRRG